MEDADPDTGSKNCQKFAKKCWKLELKILFKFKIYFKNIIQRKVTKTDKKPNILGHFYSLELDPHLHRRRIYLEDKAKVDTSDWGTESLPC